MKFFALAFMFIGALLVMPANAAVKTAVMANYLSGEFPHEDLTGCRLSPRWMRSPTLRRRLSRDRGLGTCESGQTVAELGRKRQFGPAAHELVLRMIEIIASGRECQAYA